MLVRRSDLLFQKMVANKPTHRPTARFGAFLADIGIPGDDIGEIDDALQARFFQRKPGTNEPAERWDLNKVSISCPPARFQRHLDLCGFGLATIPQRWEYRYAIWPGALLVRAAARLTDLIQAWQSGVQWEHTIVFGGQRPLLEDKETPTQALVLLGQVPDIRDVSFETLNVRNELDMMVWLWNEAKMPADMRLSATLVSVPMKPPAIPGGQPVRPNTEDTIRAWLVRKEPVPGDVLLSSGAPYGMAQDEAFWKHLGPLGFTVETFGHAAPDNLTPEVVMREVAGTVHQIRLARGLIAH